MSHQPDELLVIGIDLVNAIEHQVFAVARPTELIRCDECQRLCPRAGTCIECLRRKLGYIIGKAEADNLISSVVAYKAARERVLQIIKTGAQK